jgi:hypothetical protein
MRLNMVRRSVGLAAAVLLAGCFASKAPLVTPAAADAPIANGVALTESVNCAGDAGKLLSCSGYQARGTAKLFLKDGVYTFRPDPNAALASLFPGGVLKDVPFTLKSVGPGLFVMQLTFADEAPPDSGVQYLYELMRLDGQTAYLYEFSCEQNGDQAYVRSGALEKISQALYVPTCEPASLEGLGKVFTDRLANGAVPDEKLDIARPKR